MSLVFGIIGHHSRVSICANEHMDNLPCCTFFKLEYFWCSDTRVLNIADLPRPGPRKSACKVSHPAHEVRPCRAQSDYIVPHALLTRSQTNMRLHRMR